MIHFNFSETDLQANQSGQPSPEQAEKWKSEDRKLFVIFLIMALAAPVIMLVNYLLIQKLSATIVAIPIAICRAISLFTPPLKMRAS